MKRTIFAVIIIAAVSFFAFTKFFAAKPTPLFNITGEWRVDTVYPTHSVADSILQLIAAQKESDEGLRYRFGTDSSLTRLGSKDSIVEKYFVRDNVLHINEHQGYTRFPLRIMSDTLVSFINQDSVVFVLKKIIQQKPLM